MVNNESLISTMMGYVFLKTWFQSDTDGSSIGMMEMTRVDREGNTIVTREPTGVILRWSS